MNKDKAQERINQMKIEMAELERIIKEEDIIYVPDEIEFETILNRLGLKFDGNGCIFYKDSYERFSVDIFDKTYKVRCKLTPIKYEDIKVGDWVHANYKTNDKNFTFKTRYFLSIGNDKFRFVNDDRDILRTSFKESNHYDFLKVEKV